MAEETPIFDLEDVIIILQQATLEARRLDAVRVPVESEKGIKKGDPLVAQANRDLQHLQHLCRLALTQAEAVYWRGRGYTDPLD